MNRVVKLELGLDVRRVGRPPETIDELKKIAQELFEIESVHFQYEDLDGDKITCSSQQEYIEALGLLGSTVRFKVLGLEDVITLRYHHSEQSALIPSILSEKNQIPYDKLQKSCEKFTESIILNDISIQITDFDLYLEEILQTSSRLLVSTEIICRSCSKLIIGPGFICRTCNFMALCAGCERNHFHLLIKAYGKDVKKILSELTKPQTPDNTLEDKIRLISKDQESENNSDLHPELENSLRIKGKNKTFPAKDTNAFDKNDEKIDHSGNIPVTFPEKKANVVTRMFKKSPFDYFPSLKLSLSPPPNRMVPSESISREKPSKSPTSERTPGEAEQSYSRVRLHEYLSKLEDLGFTDKNICFKALIDNQYNVEKAAAFLFENT